MNKAQPGEISVTTLPFDGKNVCVFSSFDVDGGRGYGRGGTVQ